MQHHLLFIMFAVLSSNLIVSITGHQHTSEAQWLQCDPNEQPTHTQLSVYYPESTIGSLSVVLGVSQQTTL